MLTKIKIRSSQNYDRSTMATDYKGEPIDILNALCYGISENICTHDMDANVVIAAINETLKKLVNEMKHDEAVAKEQEKEE